MEQKGEKGTECKKLMTVKRGCETSGVNVVSKQEQKPQLCENAEK